MIKNKNKNRNMIGVQPFTDINNINLIIFRYVISYFRIFCWYESFILKETKVE